MSDASAISDTSGSDTSGSDTSGVTDIVGIRFGTSGKTYCFRAEGMGLRKGEQVVVESDLGISIGRVVRTDCEMKSPDMELKPVLRKVTEADIKQQEENEGVRVEALEYCRERVMARGLPMKLLTNEVTLDRKRFIFYFVAETRIDFRELVKDLASKFRTRIELRQIGVRDAAKILGGFGVCGRELCCKTFLKSFAPISIKMAKQQELVLNTCKLSGCCGRLMCCLSYEYVSGQYIKRIKAQAAGTEEKAVVETLEEVVLKPEPKAVERPRPRPVPQVKRAETPPAEKARAAASKGPGAGGPGAGEQGAGESAKKGRRRHRRRPRGRKKPQ